MVMRGPSYDEASRAVWVDKAPASGELEYLVHYATLAANSHNTQAWLFSGSAKQVSILPDLSRATPVVDPDNHHLFASLGCAAENLRLAAQAEGKLADINFIPDADGSLQIILSESSVSRDPLFDAIVHRQCTRADYDGREVPANLLNALSYAAKVEGCSVIIITEPAMMQAMTDLIIAANTEQVKDPKFVAELKSWLRFNAASAIEHKDGLYSGSSGNPTLPPWIGSLMFDWVFSANSENEKYARQLKSSSGIAVFVSDRDDKAHWVQAGRSYQRFALQATALGLKHAFLNQPVEVAKYRPELAHLLGIGDKPCQDHCGDPYRK
jgi:hypothetical protein